MFKKFITSSLLKIILFLVLIMQLSCSFSSFNPSKINLDRAYQSTGVNQYFLADLPRWANFSESAHCFRKEPVRYLDYNALMKSFSLNYQQASQVQAFFNQIYLSVTQKPEMKMTLIDEERMFNESLQKVQNKILFFEAPSFHTVHLINFDDYLQNQYSLTELLEFLKSSTNDSGVPVLLSSCLSTTEVQNFLKDLSLKVIGAEFFSPFNKEGILRPLMSLELSSFFEIKQKLIYFTKQKNVTAKHLIGNYKVVQY